MQENAKGGIISRIGHWWISYAGTLALAFRGIGRDSIPIMASGMVYSTLTAIIPCPTFLFAFLSIRMEGASILDFLRCAICFLFLHQQYYEWREQKP